MNLTYNGIVMRICHFNDVQMRAVYTDDGVDYLYTHYYIDVTCIVNPLATSTQGGQERDWVAVGAAQGDQMPVAVTVLERALLQKRKLLTLAVRDTVVFSVPQAFTINGVAGILAPCDANNGPSPVHAQVVAFHGEKSATLRFAIEFWVDLRSGVSPPALLASRWRATESVDRYYYTTMSVSGKSYFRTDLLQAAVLTPDAMRALVFPPLAPGFERREIQVQQSSDGATLDWQFVDQEVSVVMRPGSVIARCEGHDFVSVDWTGGQFGNPALGLPSSTEGFHVEVWGRPAATRADIGDALITLATVAGFPDDQTMGLKYTLVIDWIARHGVLDGAAVFSGLCGGIIEGWTGLGQGPLANFRGQYAETDNPYFIATQRYVAGNQPASGSRRGDALVRLFTQALGTRTASPGAPSMFAAQTAVEAGDF